MSPDPSVHEDQLRAIERTHPKKHVWRRRFGCFFLLLLVLAGAAAWLGRDRLRGFFQPGALERLREKGNDLSRTSPREMLKKMRDEAASIQEEWEELRESGKIEERLEKLRNDLAAKRDEVGDDARQAWEDVIQKSESLLKKAREKKEKLPKVELDELREKIEKLESRFGDVLNSKKSSGAEEEKNEKGPDRKQK